MVKLNLDDARHAALASTLRRISFLTPMTMGHTEKILPCIMLFAYESGETVFKKGAPAEAFYIVARGRVAILKKDGFFSLTRQVAELKAGDFFGEIALISAIPHSSTVKALEQTELFVMLKADFETILQHSPEVKAELQKLAELRKFVSTHGGGTQR